jgi:alkanesulfonate monooxygenase SsuD/methylene tetrahydromethanopterin reductase-like flavin-dependent oxidoreductase (luciferase family)
MPPSHGLAFGITAGIRPDAARLGTGLERLGYGELWSNDTRRGDGIATLAAVAPGTSDLRLAVGVVALSEHEPAAIEARLAEHDLPHGRLVLGVGSGASASLDLVRTGVRALRDSVPGVPIAIAAVGPRMLRLAGELADVVVATWSMPERVPSIRAEIAVGADAAKRPQPRLALYVRAAIGPDAQARLRTDMERYARTGRHYARAFAAQGDAPIGVAVASAGELSEALMPYRSVADTVVVRALPRADDVDAWLEVAAAAAG